MSSIPFEVASDGITLRGERHGADGSVAGGRSIVLVHGLTAHRNLVVHGSKALTRSGYELILYDARGHGDSDPGTDGDYDYEHLAGDLAAVIDSELPGEQPFLVGHSMGAHTIAALSLRGPERFAGVVLIGPATVGVPLDEGSQIGWDALADGLERDGIDGFVAAYGTGLDPAWKETLIRIARDRLGRHRDLRAVAEAVREVPRSLPFEGLAELGAIDLPALVVASHDTADPGHPRSVAEAWAESLRRSVLIGEAPGESPLAWQGGRLSREIARFCDGIA